MIVMGRPKKTPVKERKLCVYVPTNDTGDRWKHYAKKQGLSLSGFINEVIEGRIQQDGSFSSQKAIEKQNKEFQEQNTRLQSMNIDLSKKVDMLNTLTDRQQEELRKLRSRGFEEMEGARMIEPKLIDLFREHRHLKDTEIHGLLNINPRDVQKSQALNKQIDTLYNYGLIKRLKGGYQWQG